MMESLIYATQQPSINELGGARTVKANKLFLDSKAKFQVQRVYLTALLFYTRQRHCDNIMI